MNGISQIFTMPDAFTSSSTLKIYRAFQVAVIVQIFFLSFSIAISSIGFGAACVLYGVLLFMDRTRVWQPNHLEKYFLVYIAAVVLMCLFAIYPADAWINSRRGLLIAVVYFIPLLLTNKQSLWWFVCAFGVLIALQSIIEIGLYYFEALQRLGYFQNHMTTGGIKMIVLLVLIPFLFWKEATQRDKIIVGICCAIILYALILTETRSSWLGFGAGAVFIGIVSYRSVLIALTAVTLVVIFFIPGKIQERVRHMFQTDQVEQSTATIQSNINRMNMWKTGIRMFKDHPVFGVGDGQVWDIYRMYTIPHDETEGGHLHNNYIHILATHGIVGLISVFALFYGIIKEEWKLVRLKRRSLAQIVGLGSLAAFTGFFINGMAEYNFGDHEILVLLWMTVGLAVAAGRMKVITA